MLSRIVGVCCVGLALSGPGCLAVRGQQPTDQSTDDARLNKSYQRSAFQRYALERELQCATGVEFIETPLKDVLEYLQEKHGISILRNDKALTAASVDPSSPITINLKGFTLRTTLDCILRPLDLRAYIHDEYIMISTAHDDVPRMVVLSVADLVGPELSEAKLTEAVQKAAGFPDQIVDSKLRPPEPLPFTIVRGQLVGRLTMQQLEDVELFLRKFREQLKIPVAAKSHPFQGIEFGREVDLVGMKLVGDDFVYLKNSPAIRVLDLTSAYLSDSAFPAIGRLATIESLWARNSNLRFSRIPTVVQLTALQELNVSRCQTDDADLEQIAQLPNLRRLNIADNKDITVQGVKALAAAKKLTHLDLGHLQVWPEQQKHWESVLATLKRPDLSISVEFPLRDPADGYLPIKTPRFSNTPAPPPASDPFAPRDPFDVSPVPPGEEPFRR